MSDIVWFFCLVAEFLSYYLISKFVVFLPASFLTSENCRLLGFMNEEVVFIVRLKLGF